ncbi:MAG: type II toxin-antitoxin system prevent-host-death family antitoxin [Verrucomicrobia bacterium]|nr:type II toxin-antitoxin system prevent-host-death family antitoxin [Verrucomicrobiota bacterium]
MIDLHPEILSKNGKREFVVLPYEEFEALHEELEQLEDLRSLRAAKAEDTSAPSMTLNDAKSRYGVK